MSTSSYDWRLLFGVAFLVILGLAFLSSSLPSSGDLFGEFTKQILFGVWLGSVFLFIFARVDYHKLFKWRKVFFWTNFALLLYLFIPTFFGGIFDFLGFGINKNDIAGFFQNFPISPVSDASQSAYRWINIFGLIDIQPGELAKITVLILFSYSLNVQKTATYKNYKKLIWALAAIALMIVLQPDLGTVVIILIIILSGLFVSHIDFKKVVYYFLLPAIVFGFFFLMIKDYRRERVLVWFSKTVCSQDSKAYLCTKFASKNDLKDSEYQIVKVKNAVSSGGMWGTGYGKSELKNSVPELSTDGIISAIAAEGGFFMTFLMLLAYFYIFLRGIKIASEAPDMGGKILAVGISIWIITQAMWNLMGMTGYVPMKGLPLPFISKGGTAMLLNLASVGILMNISSQAVNNSTKVVRTKFNLPKRKKLVRK